MQKGKQFALSFIALAVSQILHAAEHSESDVTTLPEIVVSASKIEQSSLDAPANVSVVTASKIEKTNNQRLGDVLNAKVPGLYLRGGAKGSSKPGVTSAISLRGQSSRVAVLVDGMSMADAYSGNINWSMVSMEDVDRIEVVPGANSSLYGSSAMSGLISITTKAPTKKELSLKAGVGGGDGGGQYISALFRNKLENGLGIVIGASQKDRDGFVADYVTKTPSGTPASGAVVVKGAIPTTTTAGAPAYIIGDLGKTASTQQNIHGKLYFDLSPSSKINGGFAYSDNKNQYGRYHNYLTDSAGVPVTPPVSPAPATPLNLGGKAATLSEANFYGISPYSTALRYFAGYETKVLDNSKLTLNIGRIDRDYGYSSAGKTATLTAGKGLLTESPNSTTNASAQLSQAIGERQFLIVGVATERGRLNQKKYNLNDWSNVDSQTTMIDRMDARSVNNALFVQDQIEIGEKFTAYVGGRYDAWTAGGSSAVITPVAPAVVSSTNFADRTASVLSPKLAAVYKVNEQISIKSSIGTGFKAPNNIDLFANPTWSGGVHPAPSKMTTSNPNLKPEKSRSFDLGTEFYFSQGGNFKAAYYITKTTDLIYSKDTPVTPYTDPTFNKTINTLSSKENTGSSLARGIELSGEYPVVSWLSVSGSYAYTDAKITGDSTNTGMLGKRVTNVPKNIASLALEANKGKLSGTLSARYVGELFTSNKNSDVIKNVYTGYSKYTVADLKLSYQHTRNAKINLMVDNLFDLEYYDYYRMPGRSATVEVALNF